MVSNSVPISKWFDAGWGKIRLELREGDLVLRYRDLYNNAIFVEKALFSLICIGKTAKNVKKLMNLAQYTNNSKKIKEIATKLIEKEIDMRHREKY